MKSIIAILLLLFSGALYAGVTLTDLHLYGVSNNDWDTYPTPNWVLGVSAFANSSLINAPDTSITGLALGKYWLYAEPGNLGSNPRLVAHLSDGSTLEATFALSGAAGTETQWSRLSGSDQITLGWAAGTADRVGSGNSMVANGFNDYYLKVQIGSDNDGNGISDAVEQSIAANFGMSLGELQVLPIAAANKLTMSGWGTKGDIDFIPWCVFGVDQNSSYKAYCLTIEGDKISVTTRTPQTSANSGLSVSLTSAATAASATVCEVTNVTTTDGMLFLSAKKDGNDFAIGVNGNDFCSVSLDNNPVQFLLGADLDQNGNAKRILTPLGVASKEAIPAYEVTPLLLSESELNSRMSATQPEVPDVDRDGVLTVVDNCPTIFNTDQADADGNGIGDQCDPHTILGKYYSTVVTGTPDNDTIVADPDNRQINAGAGNDLVISSSGRQNVYGEAGSDILVYNSIDSRGDFLQDFTPDQDKIKLTKLLASVGYAGGNPITDGYVGFRASGTGCYVMFDPDGRSGKAGMSYFVYVSAVSCASLANPANFIF